MSDVKTRFPQVSIPSRFPKVTIPSRFPILGNKDSLPQPLEEITSNKLDKSQVQFESPAKGPHDCDECIHFDPSWSCYLVNGIVRPEDWCNKFELDKTKLGTEVE